MVCIECFPSTLKFCCIISNMYRPWHPWIPDLFSVHPIRKGDKDELAVRGFDLFSQPISDPYLGSWQQSYSCESHRVWLGNDAVRSVQHVLPITAFSRYNMTWTTKTPYTVSRKPYHIHSVWYAHLQRSVLLLFWLLYHAYVLSPSWTWLILAVFLWQQKSRLGPW